MQVPVLSKQIDEQEKHKKQQINASILELKKIQEAKIWHQSIASFGCDARSMDTSKDKLHMDLSYADKHNETEACNYLHDRVRQEKAALDIAKKDSMRTAVVGVSAVAAVAGLAAYAYSKSSTK